MIFIGNDIIEIERIKKITSKFANHFLNKIFSESELNCIQNKKNKIIHLSGKFCSKESVKKALCSAGIGINIFPKDIEILNKKNGQPYVRILKLKDIKYNYISLSISHTHKYATSIALIDM